MIRRKIALLGGAFTGKVALLQRFVELEPQAELLSDGEVLFLDYPTDTVHLRIYTRPGVVHPDQRVYLMERVLTHADQVLYLFAQDEANPWDNQASYWSHYRQLAQQHNRSWATMPWLFVLNETVPPAGPPLPAQLLTALGERPLACCINHGAGIHALWQWIQGATLDPQRLAQELEHGRALIRQRAATHEALEAADLARAQHLAAGGLQRAERFFASFTGPRAEWHTILAKCALYQREYRVARRHYETILQIHGPYDTVEYELAELINYQPLFEQTGRVAEEAGFVPKQQGYLALVSGMLLHDLRTLDPDAALTVHPIQQAARTGVEWRVTLRGVFSEVLSKPHVYLKRLTLTNDGYQTACDFMDRCEVVVEGGQTTVIIGQKWVGPWELPTWFRILKG